MLVGSPCCSSICFVLYVIVDILSGQPQCPKPRNYYHFFFFHSLLFNSNVLNNILEDLFCFCREMFPSFLSNAFNVQRLWCRLTDGIFPSIAPRPRKDNQNEKLCFIYSPVYKAISYVGRLCHLCRNIHGHLLWFMVAASFGRELCACTLPCIFFFFPSANSRISSFWFCWFVYLFRFFFFVIQCHSFSFPF